MYLFLRECFCKKYVKDKKKAEEEGFWLRFLLYGSLLSDVSSLLLPKGDALFGVRWFESPLFAVLSRKFLTLFA